MKNISNNTSLNTSLNTLFRQNKTNMEELVKTAEGLSACVLRGRATSERTFFAYERTYLSKEEVKAAKEEELLPGQKNNKDIKLTSKGTFYRETKTSKSGFMDAHIENTYNGGEKYYHLMTADNDQSFFITKFYDKPLATICATENKLLYIQASSWVKVDKKSYERLVEEMGDKATSWGPYNESVYIAINKSLQFDNNGKVIDPFVSVYQNFTGKNQLDTEMYIGRPCFKGYTGHSASYKNGEKANKTLLVISELMGEEALSENSYAKCADIERTKVTKSILTKGYYYNKGRGDIAIDGQYKDLVNHMACTISEVAGLKAKYDIYPVLLGFIISQHIDFVKNTVGIRTARRECDLLEELEKYLGEK